MTQRNDQVFQLSLTEIAFTIAFILLLLLGYLVVKEQSERMAAEAALANVRSVERAAAALDVAKDTLVATLEGAGVDSADDVVTKLIAVEDVRAERDQLKRRVDDLDAKLTALEELQKQLENAAPAKRPDITRDEISAALALQEQVRKAVEDAETPLADLAQQSAPVPAGKTLAATPAKSTKSSAPLAASQAKSPKLPEASSRSEAVSKASKAQHSKEALETVRQALAATSELKRQLKAQLNKDLTVGQESQTVREVVTAAKGYMEMAAGANPERIKKENSDLRGQVAFLKNRLDARGGRDYPPCWADESGKVEFLFSVDVKPDSIVVNPAWPPRRDDAARALPGMDDVLAGPHSNLTFVNRIQGLFNWSKNQDPECRHYVQLKSSISDAVQSDRARLMVENYFYKTEIRR